MSVIKSDHVQEAKRVEWPLMTAAAPSGRRSGFRRLVHARAELLTADAPLIAAKPVGRRSYVASGGVFILSPGR